MDACEPQIEHPPSGAFDVVVLGTGLMESLVAAAAAKAGKTVLHVDHEAHYGAEWASFGAATLEQWLAAGDAAVAAATGDGAACSVAPGEVAVHAAAAVRRRCAGVSFLGPDAAPDAPLASRRGFSVDLAGPKVIYCSGLLVDTLLRSGAHSYVEFKAVEAVALLQDGQLRPVPSSRSDVFTSTQLSASDKRALMRTLKAATDAAAGGEASQGLLPTAAPSPPSPFSDGAHPSFDAALSACGLNPTLRAAVIHALALLDSQHGVPVATGLAALHRYMSSLGRYTGAGAFLVPLYGSAELPQAFCRSAAVAGATYVLRRPVEALLTDPDTRRVTGIRLGGNCVVKCTALAAHGAYLDGFTGPGGEAATVGGLRNRTHRCVCITDASLLPDKQQVLAIVPPGAVPSCASTSAVRVLQFGPSACLSPEGRYVVFISVNADDTSSSGEAAPPDASPSRDALLPVVAALLDITSAPADGSDSRAAVGVARKPHLRWAMFSTHIHGGAPDDSLPPNVALCPGAGPEPDMCASVSHAQAAFDRLFPDSTFFPPPPDGATGEADSDDDMSGLLAPAAARTGEAELEHRLEEAQGAIAADE